MVRLSASDRAGDGEPSSRDLTQRSRFRLPHCRNRFGSPEGFDSLTSWSIYILKNGKAVSM